MADGQFVLQYSSLTVRRTSIVVQVVTKVKKKKITHFLLTKSDSFFLLMLQLTEAQKRPQGERQGNCK